MLSKAVLRAALVELFGKSKKLKSGVCSNVLKYEKKFSKHSHDSFFVFSIICTVVRDLSYHKRHVPIYAPQLKISSSKDRYFVLVYLSAVFEMFPEEETFQEIYRDLVEELQFEMLGTSRLSKWARRKLQELKI